ncbi:Replication protein A DNA-binding subunit B [Zea mays]|uniref:Replication protein A DNA-binding subunit B n=1 Tax=Zea mays TaxID=4577 RepID=A0A3L6EC80_MAIZE|nr:Replication protein A DNA-binding subunit B [Zea mays]
MEITPISQLRPGKLNYALHVRISRMWEFRGTNEQNDIKHLDLVLIDQKGNSIYAEIPPDAIAVLKPHLQEKKIVYISKITIERAKLGFRVVDNPYMVKLNKRTIVLEDKDEIQGFPKYTFSLTPLDKLDQYKNKTDRFIDVIAKISGVSNVAKVPTTSGDQQMRRVVLLEDLKGNMIELSLSEKEFWNLTEINFRCGSATSCYCNICRNLSQTLQSLPSEPVPIKKTYLQNDDATHKFEEKSLEQLKHVDPFLDMGMELIGKSASTLRKQYEPKEIPPDITSWIGYKFTFVVRVLSKKSVKTIDPSFEVLMIKEKYQKEPIISFISSSGVVPAESSSSTMAEYKELPLLMPITSKDIEKRSDPLHNQNTPKKLKIWTLNHLAFGKNLRFQTKEALETQTMTIRKQLMTKMIFHNSRKSRVPTLKEKAKNDA